MSSKLCKKDASFHFETQHLKRKKRRKKKLIRLTFIMQMKRPDRGLVSSLFDSQTMGRNWQWPAAIQILLKATGRGQKHTTLPIALLFETNISKGNCIRWKLHQFSCFKAWLSLFFASTWWLIKLDLNTHKKPIAVKLWPSLAKT